MWPLVCDVVQSSGRLVLLVLFASGVLMLVVLCSAQSLLAGTALACLLLTLFASAFGAVVGVLGCSGMVAL